MKRKLLIGLSIIFILMGIAHALFDTNLYPNTIITSQGSSGDLTYDFTYSAYNTFTFNYSHIPAHLNVTINGGTGILYFTGDKLQ